jgi:hypothetical protein
MKTHYDFSKARQGVMHQSVKSLRIPFYLDDDVQRKLTAGRRQSNGHLSKLVNKILRSQIGVPELLK